MLTSLLGGSAEGFRGSPWPADAAHFRANPEWFAQIAALPVLTDPQEWLDRAPQLASLGTLEALARSEARRRYTAGETIYILGLDRALPSLRELCDRLADDLAVSPAHVALQAWAAGGPTSVAMHFDLDDNFNIQISGRKEWQTAPNRQVVHPLSSVFPSAARMHAKESEVKLPTEMPSDATTFWAEPGDVVYLPRGVWHATRTAGPTFAMAFVIQPPTWADHVSRALRDRLHLDPRWRERVMGARAATQHSTLKATAADAIAAARDLLAELGPSETLYPSLWGQRPAFFRRRRDVTDCRFDASSARLSWQRGEERGEVSVPAWAHTAAEHLARSDGRWSIASLQDLVGDDDVVFLNVFVRRLTDGGLLEPAP